MFKNRNIFEGINIRNKTHDKKEEKVQISTFKIAATYIGTVVGAGFASGQEVLQFFGYYGIRGFGGLILTTLLFIIYGYIILRLGMDYNARSHLRVIHYGGGKRLGFLIDIVITFFLFGALTAMVAGSGAIFKEQLGIHPIFGNIIMVLAALGTTILGIRGVISAISFVVPLLLTGVVFLALYTVFTNPVLDYGTLVQVLPGQPAVPNWILSAVVYTSYNLIIAVAVLAPLGAEVKDKQRLQRGSILGGIGLGIGAAIILFTLLLNMPGALEYEIPMIYVASRFNPLIQLIYSIILLAEIYTTAVGNLYGFVIRLTDSGGVNYRKFLVITGIVALAASQFGFTSLVRYLYPMVGYAGILMMVGLTIGILKEFKIK